MGSTQSRSKAVTIAIGIAVALVCVIALADAFHRQLDKGWAWYGAIFTVFAPVLTFLGFLIAHRRGIFRFLKEQPPTTEELNEARKNLHSALSAAWSEDVSEVYEDRPMRVRFGPWKPETGESQAGVGDFTSVAKDFAEEPRYRRVILGEAGAGKSVLVGELQRKLIEVPSPGDPLPVIMPAASWLPEKHSLLEWVARRLARDYGWLPVSHARALVARGLVLPILDGLDELSPTRYSQAIRRINKHHVYRPLIVTSREGEFLEAIVQNRPGVKGCPVIEVQPLLREDVKTYLTDTPTGWAEVLDPLDDGAPLVTLLSNPLMLYLARVEYEDKDPHELTQFSGEQQIRQHLLSQFVPTVYARKDGLFSCSPRQAERWLGHLSSEAYAEHRTSGGESPDAAAASRSVPLLAWWDFDAGVGAWRRVGIAIRGAAQTALSFFLLVWVLKRSGDWRDGHYTGPVDFSKLLLGGPVGRLIRPTLQTLTGAAEKGFGINFIHGWHDLTIGVGWLVVKLPFTIAAVAALVAIAAVRAQARPKVPVRLRLRARRTVGFAARAFAGRFVIAGLVALGLLWLAKWPVSAEAFYKLRATWIALLAFSLFGLSEIPATLLARSDTSSGLSPEASLRLDREADAFATFARWGANIAAAWLLCGPAITDAYAAYAVGMTIIAVLLGGQSGLASRQYTDAHLWLVVLGRAPWRTMAFLKDASDRGVLRQVGAAYRFRDVRLLDEVSDWRKRPSAVSVWSSQLRAGALDELAPAGLSVASKPAWLQRELERVTTMARARGGTFPPDLITALNGFADGLSRLGFDQAWPLVEELINTYDELASASPEVFRRGELKAMDTFSREGQWSGLARTVQTTTTSFHKLAAADPEAHLAGLIAAVPQYAYCLTELRHNQEALLLLREMVNTTRRKAEAAPDTFEVVYSDALDVLATGLRELGSESVSTNADGQTDNEVLRTQRTAVDVGRSLAARYPDRYLARLGSALAILASDLRQLRRYDEEHAAILETLDSCRRRAELVATIRRNIVVGLPADLMQSLDGSVRSRWLAARAKRGPDSLWSASAQQAVVRAMATAGSVAPDALPGLSEALRGLAGELFAATRWREARTLDSAADAIRGQFMLKTSLPEEDSPGARLELTACLAWRLWELGSQASALTAVRDGRDLAPRYRGGTQSRLLAHATFALCSIRFWLYKSLADKRNPQPDEFVQYGADLERAAFRCVVAGVNRVARLAMIQAEYAQSKAVAAYQAVSSPLLGQAETTLERLKAAGEAIEVAQRHGLAGVVPAPEYSLATTSDPIDGVSADE